MSDLRQEIKSDVAKVQSDVDKIPSNIEEQNARNKFVLDGYTSLSDRLDKVEKQIKEV